MADPHDEILILHSDGKVTMDPSVWRRLQDPVVRFGLAALERVADVLNGDVPASAPVALPPATDPLPSAPRNRRDAVAAISKILKGGPVTMREICERTGIPRSTARHHLKQIDGLVRHGTSHLDATYSLAGAKDSIVIEGLLREAGAQGIRLSALAKKSEIPADRCRKVLMDLGAREERISNHSVFFLPDSQPGSVSPLEKVGSRLVRGPFGYDPDSETFFIHGQLVDVPDKTMEVGSLLVREGRVPRDEFPSKVGITPQALRHRIMSLRRMTSSDAIRVDGMHYII